MMIISIWIPGGVIQVRLPAVVWKKLETVSFGGERGLLKPVAPYFVHDYFQLSEKGGKEQSVSL
jgi:hypothetical protein